MSGPFDPYYEWLGIAPEEQPPNYYRLLNLTPFEANRDRITRGAAMQLRRVKQQTTGPHGAVARSIADEIAAARLCLVSDKMKRSYDARLREAGLDENSSGPPPVVPPPVKQSRPAPSDGGGHTQSGAAGSAAVPPHVETVRLVTTHSPAAPVARRRQQTRSVLRPVLEILLPLISFAIGLAILAHHRPELNPFASAPAGPDRQEAVRGQPEPAPEHDQPPPSAAATPPSQRDRSAVDVAPASSEPSDPGAELAEDPSSAALSGGDALSFLPDAVDLPPLDRRGWFTISTEEGPHDVDPKLLLISRSLSPEGDRRLELSKSDTSRGALIWHVDAAEVDEKDVPKAAPTPQPLAELRWCEGRLQFRWKFAAERSLRTALVNSLLNVRIGGEERLVRLRRPTIVSAIPLDLSKRLSRSTVEVPHLPPAHQLRFEVTEVDFAGLRHEWAEDQWDVKLGQKVPVDVTGTPRVQFHIWATPMEGQLAFAAEGYYRLGNSSPAEFSQHRVETQAKAFMQRRRVGQAAIPRLQQTISTLESRIARLNKIPANAVMSHHRAMAGVQIQVMRVSLAKAKNRLARAHRDLSVASVAFGELKKVSDLGNRIHGLAPFRYRVYLPIEYEGVSLEVDVVETGDESAPAAGEANTFDLETMKDAGERQPVPTDEQRQGARRRLAEKFEQPYQEAEDPASQKRLARTLLSEASRTSRDPARRFELLTLAWKLLAMAGEVDAALDVAGQIEHLHEVDRLPLRAAVVRRAASAADERERISGIADAVVDVVDEAVLEDEYDLAMELLGLAKSVQEKTAAPPRPEELQERIEFLEAEQQLNHDLETLPFTPDDAAAHLRVGRTALVRGRPWSECVEVLAKGGQHPLAEAARSDRSAPEDPAEQLGLADRWYDLGESESAELRPYLCQRAGKWYAEALPHLSGFSKDKAKSRLETLKPPGDQPETEGNAARSTR